MWAIPKRGIEARESSWVGYIVQPSAPEDSAQVAVDDGLAITIERAIVQDRQAFGELYSRYLDRVYRYAYYSLGNAQEAEDVAAQTFLQAWQAIGRYRPTGAPFISWLLRIAHNIVVSHHRSRRNHAPLLEAVVRADGRESPLETCQRQEDQRRLIDALGRLKDVHRRVLILRFADELSYAEVAAILGKSVAAARVIQHRALGALRRLLEDIA